MLELYHNDMSTCSQKVRLALAEKEVEWTSKLVSLLAGENKTPEFLALNPNGVVPVLVKDKDVILESSIINEFVEDNFEGPSLLPKTAVDRAYMRMWIRQIDEKIHPAIGAITFSTALRDLQRARPRDEVVAEIEKTAAPEYVAFRISLFDHGMESPEFKRAAETYVSFLRKVEQSIEETWLIGNRFTLADCALAPYIIRLDHLGAAPIWEKGRFPKVEAWLAALKARSSFKSAIADWASEPMLNLLRPSGDKLVPALEKHLS